MIVVSQHSAKNKAGSVIFVGCAARLIANTGTLITHMATHKAKLLLAKKMMDANAEGTANPIKPKKVIASHNILLSSWSAHQLIKFEKVLFLD